MGAEIVRRADELKSTRGTWEQHWTEIAEIILPSHNNFIFKPYPGMKRTGKMYDATSALALIKFAAAMESMLTPRSQKWHGLTSSNSDLNKNRDVQLWFEEASRRLFSARYAPKANYASQQHEVYMSLGAFGTGGLFIDDGLEQGIRYKSIHLGELFIEESFEGRIDTVYRRFELTARQAFQKFGDALPETIKQKAKDKPDEKFEFIHCVKPNDDRDPERADHKGMEYKSTYVSVLEKKPVQIGGYHEFPYAISRYITTSNEVYGRSPATIVLPGMKMLNEMKKTTIRAGQKRVDPPLLLTDDGILGGVDLTPGATNYGGVDPRTGRQNVIPLNVGADIGLGIEMQNIEREQINDSFLLTVFQLLIKTPQMSATEVLERARERGALLTPTVGRQQAEALGPMIERELGIKIRAGAMPPLPPELIEADGEFDIIYNAPLNRAQRADEAVGLFRTIEGMAPIAQADPSIMRRLNGDEILVDMAEINGMPSKWLRSDEELKAIDDQAAGQQQAAQLLEAAPVASKVAVDMAQLQAGG